MRTIGFLIAATFAISALAQPAIPVDINTATAAQLQALPGMGAEYARRVIAGRPYTMKNQLLQRGVLPQGSMSASKTGSLRTACRNSSNESAHKSSVHCALNRVK
jgi:hypothetical protein